MSNESASSDRYREPCPSCGTEMERYVPTAWHCPECDRDYWKEGDSWWSCDVSGEPELVEMATDGGTERSPGVWEGIESPFSAVSPFSWWFDMALFILAIVVASLGVAVVVL